MYARLRLDLPLLRGLGRVLAAEQQHGQAHGDAQFEQAAGDAGLQRRHLAVRLRLNERKALEDCEVILDVEPASVKRLTCRNDSTSHT